METDRIQMDDFNDMTDKIDTALEEQGEILAEHTAAMAGFGNCRIYTASYTGNGIDQNISHTFPAKPVMIMVCGSTVGLKLLAWRECPAAFESNLKVTWTGNTVTWPGSVGTPGSSLNYSGYTYCILALLEQGA